MNTTHAHSYVFDLDGNVVLPNQGKIENSDLAIAQKLLDEEDLPLHRITVLGDCEHFVFPGFYALFRWLHAQGHEIHFFSSAIHERNAELVPKLLKNAFGEAHSQELLPRIKIASRPNLFDAEQAFRNYQDLPENRGRGYYEMSREFLPPVYGNKKKKMSGVICSPEALPNTLLLEDDRSYMAKGEEYNILVARGSDYAIGSEFAQLNRACFYAGLIQRIETWCRENDQPLVEGARHWQFTARGLMMEKDFFFATYKDRDYYTEGLALLLPFNPKLRLYPGGNL